MSSQNSHQKEKDTICLAATLISGGYSGPGYFYSILGVGYSSTGVGVLACKDEETALYVATQFGQLVFDAIYAGKAWYVWNY